MNEESSTAIASSSDHGVTLSLLELKRSRPEDLDGGRSSIIAKKARGAPCNDSDTEAADIDSAALTALRGRYKHDPTYYMEDGSCILLVEDTLFNVHRTILSKDTSSFSTMFTLPQGGHDAEGCSDDNPIVLTGDTVSEFQHFLWALYALPPELRLVTSEGADLVKLIDIARISNKYSFKTLETWTLDVIHDYVNQRPSPILTTIPAPSAYTFSMDPLPSTPRSSGATIKSTEQFTKLIRIAQMCNHGPLLGTMIGLLKQLMSSSLQYAYLAMTLADELDLRSLKGVAYLEVMQKAVIATRSKADSVLNRPSQPHLQGQPQAAAGGSGANNALTSTTSRARVGDDQDHVIITRSQQLRLLSGYYRLTKTWDTLRMVPPPFDHAISCGATWHQHGCTQSWLEFWKEKTKTDVVLSLGLADVLGRLKQVQKDYDRWGSATYMHHDCRMAARRSILDIIKAVEDALPDYFSECGDDD